MSAKHAENPHTFQSLQLNLRGERNAGREKTKWDVEAGKDTKKPPQQSESLHFPLQLQLCESWQRQMAGITFLQRLAQCRHCSLRSEETDVFKKCVCVCLVTLLFQWSLFDIMLTVSYKVTYSQHNVKRR